MLNFRFFRSVEGDLQALDAVRLHVVNEYSTRAIAAKVVRRGDVVLDLGANEGFHTANLSELAGERGKVHAFEPNPIHWAGLLGRPNVRLWPMAVGDAVSVETLFVPADYSHQQVASIVDPRDFIGMVGMRTLSVPQVTIDSLEEIADQPVTFVKMDIERREFQCLRGMAGILRASKPVVVLENLTNEIRAFLESVDYSVFSMVNGLSVDDRLANVLAVPNSRYSELGEIALSRAEFAQVVDEAAG